MRASLARRRRRLYGGGDAIASAATLFPGTTLQPWRMDTLFTDTAGQTLGNAPGDLIRVAIDPSRGMEPGPELVTNGTFDSNITGWSLVGGGAQAWDASGGIALTDVAGADANSQANITTVIGRVYRVTWRVRSVTGGGQWLFRIRNSTDLQVSEIGTTGVFSRLFVASTVNNTVNLVSASTGQTIVFDDISVKELPYNYALQPDTAKAYRLVRYPKSGRRNIVPSASEDLSNGQWGRTRTTLVGINKFVADATADTSHTTQINGLAWNGVSSTISFDATAAEISILYVQMGSGAIATFNLATGLVGSYTLGTLTRSMVALGGGVYRCTMSCTPNSNACLFFLGEGDGSTLDVTLAGTRTGEGLFIDRVQPEAGATATAYQKVASEYDITETGFYDCWGLQPDGSNDFYATAATLDLTASDQVAVFMGLTKNSDAATRVALEFSASIASNNGAFLLTSPASNGAISYSFAAKGTLQSVAGDSVFAAAPDTCVLDAYADISADTINIYRNGELEGTSAADLGTGNFGNYTVYDGSRAGTSLFQLGPLWGRAIFGMPEDHPLAAGIRAQIAYNTPGVYL